LPKNKSSKLPPDPRIKVGNVKEYFLVSRGKGRRPSKKPIFYTYKDIQYDDDLWADTTKYLPQDFDLIYMKLKKGKTLPGWINKTRWCGLRLQITDEVIFWKRHTEEGY
jgi:hypothetical protein